MHDGRDGRRDGLFREMTANERAFQRLIAALKAVGSNSKEFVEVASLASGKESYEALVNAYVEAGCQTAK